LDVVMVAGGPVTGKTVTVTGADEPEHPEASNAVTVYVPDAPTTIDGVVSPPGDHM
jgi:hypothetical protein